MLDRILRTIEKFIPVWLYQLGQPVYHWLLALAGALIYRFPSHEITVIAVTGTKGKSTTTELLASIFEAAGYKTASLSTVRFKIGNDVRPNMFKMTVPGRFFVQGFLRDAVSAGCTHAVLEMSSQAALQFRHKHIDFDGLIFTNLAPEHIESHGSYENYRDAKLGIARAVMASRKPHPVIVANLDDAEGQKFLDISGTNGVPYRLTDAETLHTSTTGSTFTFRNQPIELHIPGTFNVMNALGAATMALEFGVTLNAIAQGLGAVSNVRGRVEYVHEGQPFDVVVDYAHTPESLESLYGVFAGRYTICILGNTGGGRDTWKRPVMAGIAEKYCNEIILTNEDPYDEDPRAILADMEGGIADKQKASVVLDRREAMSTAFKHAGRQAAHPDGKAVTVLITGKGTDPYIMTAGGTKVAWDDATVAREELRKLTAHN